MRLRRPAAVSLMLSPPNCTAIRVFNNDAEMREIAAKEFPTLPKDDLDAILTRARNNDMWQQDGAMPEEAWEKTKSIITISGVLKEDVPYKDVFDPQFL